MRCDTGYAGEFYRDFDGREMELANRYGADK
jgi:hypothetical protein